MLIQILLIKKELIKFCNNFDIDKLPKINLIIGKKICMARVYDSNNINKRCIFNCLNNINMCLNHLEKSKFGFVNKYPSNDILKLYDNNQIENINLNHNSILGPIIFTYKTKKIKIKIKINFNKNLKTKNKIKDNSKMDLETIRNTQQYVNILTSVQNEDNDKKTAIARQKLKDIYENLSLTIKEYEQLKYDLQPDKSEILQNKKKSKNLKKSKLNEININKLDTFKIIDVDFNSCEVYMLDADTSTQYLKNIEGHWDCILINENRKRIGECRDWKDDDDVPAVHKANNIVLNPDTRMPIMEVVISKQGGIFANLNPGIYREYEYDEEWDELKKTQNVIRGE